LDLNLINILLYTSFTQTNSTCIGMALSFTHVFIESNKLHLSQNEHYSNIG